MGVIQLEFEGLFREIVGGKVYIEKNETQVETKHVAGGKCRQCNYFENSDGMHGAHCGHCECCSEE